MTHIRTLSRVQSPAYARSVLEWEQIANVLILFAEFVTGAVAAAEAVLGFANKEEGA